MSLTVLDLPQRSPEWFAARAGRLTGSVADAAIMAVKKNGDEPVGRRDLRLRLVCERLTGVPQEDSYINAAMQWGIDQEAHAFAAFEVLTGEVVTRTGFCQDDTRMIGCSLDGHIGAFDALVSLKCPKSATHLRYLRAGTFPADYVPQMLHELWVVPTAKVYHFLSFDPRFPDKLRTFLVSVPRPEQAVAEYAAKADAFLAEVDAELEAVRRMVDGTAPTMGSLVNAESALTKINRREN